MNWKKEIYLITLMSLMVMGIMDCAGSGESVLTSESNLTAHPEGWSDETHGNNVDPNYEIVFPQDKVNQITITITPEDWNAMQENMTELLGPRGTGERRGPIGAPGIRPDNMVRGDIPPDGEGAPRAPGILG